MTGNLEAMLARMAAISLEAIDIAEQIIERVDLAPLEVERWLQVMEDNSWALTEAERLLTNEALLEAYRRATLQSGEDQTRLLSEIERRGISL